MEGNLLALAFNSKIQWCHNQKLLTRLKEAFPKARYMAPGNVGMTSDALIQHIRALSKNGVQATQFDLVMVTAIDFADFARGLRNVLNGHKDLMEIEVMSTAIRGLEPKPVKLGDLDRALEVMLNVLQPGAHT